MTDPQKALLVVLGEKGKLMEALREAKVSWAVYQGWRKSAVFARAVDAELEQRRLTLAEQLESKATDMALGEGKADPRLMQMLLRSLYPERYNKSAKGGEMEREIVYVHDWPQLAYRGEPRAEDA